MGREGRREGERGGREGAGEGGGRGRREGVREGRREGGKELLESAEPDPCQPFVEVSHHHGRRARESGDKLE